MEKVAIVSLLIEMINADMKVAYEELITFNLICRKLGIDHNAFAVGRELKYHYALNVVKNMTQEKKRQFSQMLVDIIDSDTLVDDKEIKLLNHICSSVGIDLLF